MSYPVVIVIIIITAVVSYLIGIFDAKTTNKWFGTDKPSPKTPEPSTVIDPSVKKLALIQSNDQNELFVEFDDALRSSVYSMDKLNKRKLIELISALGRLGEVVTPKTHTPKEKLEPKEKLALQRSLIGSIQKAPHKKLNEVTDLVSLINHALEEDSGISGQVLEIREDQDHELSFWVDEKSFSSVDEVEPLDARERFKNAIDSVNH